MNCINTNSEEYKQLLEKTGLNPVILKSKISVWQDNNSYDSFPSVDDILGLNEINFSLKSIDILSTDKAKEIFTKGKKNNWSLDKILSELQIPKEQKELILDNGKINLDDIITDLLAKYSYTVEVNTTKINNRYNIKKDNFIHDGVFWIHLKEDRNATEEESELLNNKTKNINTSYYSDLSVPGGTNYTENEIATPAIVPSIKGHAQFSTDKGIGWFRSDDKSKSIYEEEYNDEMFGKFDAGFRTTNNTDKKTRRILEIQSDLFQKGRDSQDLISKTFDKNLKSKIEKAKQNNLDNRYIEGLEYQLIQQEKFKNLSDNQFLQLLNKNNNWITFFTKSIIQDSAKKGYEKVLFPVGDTAAKIEGHETVQGFIDNKQRRLKELKEEKNKAQKPYKIGDYFNRDMDLSQMEEWELKGQNKVETQQEVNELNKPFTKNDNEIQQLEKEIEDAKAGKLKISFIANFYETTVFNILKKQGFNPIKIKDEYDNSWYEIQLDINKNTQTIFANKFDKKIDFSKVTDNSKAEIFNDVKPVVDAIKGNDYGIVHNDLLFRNSDKKLFTAKEVLDNIISSSNIELINGWEFYFMKALNLVNNSGAKVRIVSEEEFYKLDEKFDEGTIMGYDPTNNTIYISKDIIKKYNPEIILSSFIHEVSHSTSIDAYSNPKTFEQQDLKDLINEAFEQYKYLAERKSINKTSYGFTNPLEFISEIYSNPQFRREVQQIEGFWEKFIAALRRLIGLPSSLKNRNLIESTVLFDAVDNIVEIDNSKWKGSIVYKDFLAKQSDDIFTDLSTTENKLDKTISKFNESIDKNIEHFRYLKKVTKNDKKAENITEHLKSLFDLREDIVRNSEADKIKSVIAFSKYMNNNLNLIKKRLNTFDTSDLSQLKNVIRAYDNYLSLFSVIDDVIDVINELRFDENQEFISKEDLNKLEVELTNQKGNFDSLVNKMDLFKRKAFAQHIDDIKYFPDIEKKNYNRLAKEHKDNNIPENKEIWIARQMNGRDKELIEKEVGQRINQLLNNPSVDIYYTDVLFSSSINVSDPLIQIMNQMLQEVDNKRISIERKKDLEFKRLFQDLVKEKGSNNVNKLYENIIHRDKDGKLYLLGEYNPDFYRDVYEKIKTVRREYNDQRDAQWITIKETKESFGQESKQYKDELAKLKILSKNKEAEIKKIEQENLDFDSKGKFVKIKDKWLAKQPNLSKTEKEVLEFFKTITEDGAKATYGKQNLIKYAYKAQFYELPKITKTDAERVWSGQTQGILKDKWTDLTSIKPDDVGYDTREIGVDGKPITSLKVHYRSNNFDHKTQSLNLMNVYRLDYKNTNTYKIRKGVELELNMLLDVVKNKKFYDKSGTRFRVKRTTGKINIKEGQDTNTYNMMKNMLESKFYDILKKGDVKLGNTDVNKIVKHVNGISSMLTLSFNVASGTANVLNAQAQIFLESFIKGQHIKASSVGKANKLYVADLGNILSDNIKPIQESFVNQISEEFNVKGLINLSNSNFIQSDLLKRGLSRELAQVTQTSGEHWIQSVITMSVLDGIKVMDKNFNYIDKDGNIVEESKAASLLDMYSKDPQTGFLQVSDKVVYTTNSKTATYNEGGKEKIDALIYKKMYDSIGNYRQNDQPDVYRHWLGNLTMLYRKYLVPMGTSRFRGIEFSTKRQEDLSDDQKRFSYALQENEEGIYTSLIRYIVTSLRDKKYYLLSKDNWNKLTDYEKHNIKRAVVEQVVVWVVLPLVVSLLTGLAGGGDDDDEKLYFTAYALRRLDTELSQYMSIKENFKIMRSPIPSARLIETAGDLFGKVFNPFNWDELNDVYEQGPNKGENKVKIKFEKQIPLVKEFVKQYQDLYEYQNSNWGTGL